MSEKHNPTPWTSGGAYITDSNGYTIADTNGYSVADALAKNRNAKMRYANSARIAACVNACEGMSNEQLIKNPVLELLKKTCESHNQERLDKKIQEGIAYRMKSERDELLVVLKNLVICSPALKKSQIVETLRAAIAKAEKGSGHD